MSTGFDESYNRFLDQFPDKFLYDFAQECQDEFSQTLQKVQV